MALSRLPARSPALAGGGGRLPVHVLTGFLGSGKTTLLRRMLAQADFADTAVIINEFGEIGLDHLLVREVAEDVVLLPSGCLCCGVRDDLASTLAGLLESARAGAIPAFRRVVVETSGLADPAPVMSAIAGDRSLNAQFAPGVITATVDAVGGAESLRAFTEARQQVALASRLLITKTDLVDDGPVAMLAGELAALNPLATPMRLSRDIAPRFSDVFPPHHDTTMEAGRPSHAFRADWAEHSSGIGAFTVSLERPVAREAFIEWLELLLAARGDSILRVKGLLAVTESDLPHVVHGVRQLVFPLETMPRWPAGISGTELVFIARDLTPAAVRQSLEGLLPV